MQTNVEGEVRIELPAQVGAELIESGFASSANSADRSPAEAMDLAISVVGAAGPVIVVAVANGVAKVALQEVWRLLVSSWQRRRAKERFALEVRRGSGRVMVKVEVAGDSPEEAIGELLSAADRVLSERSGEE